jgi:hypothetical protein
MLDEDKIAEFGTSFGTRFAQAASQPRSEDVEHPVRPLAGAGANGATSGLSLRGTGGVHDAFPAAGRVSKAGMKGKRGNPEVLCGRT